MSNTLAATNNNSTNNLTWKTVMGVLIPIMLIGTFVMNQGWKIVQSATASTKEISTVTVRVDALEKKGDKGDLILEDIRKEQRIQADRQYRKLEEVFRLEGDMRSRLDRMETQNQLIMRKLKL
jgi:hypothetical protein